MKTFQYLCMALLCFFFQGIVLFLPFQNATAQSVNIKNDTFWYTKDKTPINSQGGGIFRFKDPSSGLTKYYWYGVHYVEGDLYRKDPSVTQSHATFQAVTCYSSLDLVNWTDEGNVLTQEEVNAHGKTWLGRLGVAYITELQKYAMVVQHGGKVMFAVADSPAGAFKWQHEISMEKMIGTSNTGDQTIFFDEDSSKSYLVYSYGRGRNKIYISEIGVKDGLVDLLDCTQIFKGESREGNCMFKYKGKYYMFASNIYGWDSSLAYYLVADNIKGPYLPANDMQVLKGSENDYAHVTQTGFFLSVKGSEQETILYCGDRWADFAGNGLGYNQWFPISFDGSTPYFNSLNSWNLNAHTGKWNVAADNDYIINGSFEADRKRIPSIAKPVQKQLTGWESVVIEGRSIELDSTRSPFLNYFNTTNDRKHVIGEKSLLITDEVNFKRKVFQKINSTPFVKLPDGMYALSAKLKNSAGLSLLEMYGLSNKVRSSTKIEHQNADWTTVTINDLKVSNGNIEIGFIVQGNAKAFCLIDDISLKRTR